MKIIKVPINKINPYKHNPRKISDKELSGLTESIKKFDFVEPLVVNKRSNTLVGGHARLRAAETLGYKEIPIVEVDLSPAEEKALNVALNSPTIAGKFDEDILGSLLDEIKIDLPELHDLLNFDELIETEEEIKKGKTDDDEVPEVNEPPVTDCGDVWLLGDHRVMCGDSTMIDDVEKLMDGKKADMVFTSPPYNANTSFQNCKNSGKLYNNYEDNLSSNEYIEFASKCLENAIVKTCGYVFWNVNYNSNSRSEYIKQIIPHLNILDETICWKKTALPVPSGLTRTWEPIFVFNTRKDKKRIGHLNKTEFNFWEISNINALDEKHRAAFPVSLPEKAISLVNPQNVLDLFLGSGSTLIACEKTNRKCYGMEIDQHYCDVVINRWQNFSGKDAVLESTGESYNFIKGAK